MLKRKRQNKKGRFPRLGSGGGAAGTPQQQTQQQQQQQPESLFTGFTPKNSRFLGNLNPARWGKKSASSPSATSGGGGGGTGGTGAGAGGEKRDSSSSTSLSKPPSNPSLTGSNREKAKGWVRDEAQQFLTRYQLDAPCTHPALTVLSRLTAAIQRLQSNVSSTTVLCALRNPIDAR